MRKQYDTIVVGAGPAGTSAALVLARAGLDVVLLERGEFPGAKNMFGGVLNGHALNDLVPEFWHEAPIERRVTRRVLTALSEDSSVSLDFSNPRLGQFPTSGITVFRSRFDRWFSQKAVAAGATLICEALVDELILDHGKVVGVRVGREDGDLYAPVVIVADGANSRLVRNAEHEAEVDPAHIGIGVKETIRIPKEILEERFGLGQTDGVAMEFIGGRRPPINYGGFIYTNRDSLSVGVVCQLASLTRSGSSVIEVLDDFKAHPTVSRLIRGGEVREYSAHLVPQAGAKAVPKLFADGMLVAGDSAGLVLSTGIHLEGVNFAIASGAAAAETVKAASLRRDFSASSLSHYEALLKDRFVLKDLDRFRTASDFLANDRLHALYPALLSEFLTKLYVSDGRPRPGVLSLARRIAKGRVSLWTLLQDTIKAGRAL